MLHQQHVDAPGKLLVRNSSLNHYNQFSNELSECSMDAAYELNRRRNTAPKGAERLPVTVYRARQYLGLLPSEEERKA
jgi:hypothetical protein